MSTFTITFHFQIHFLDHFFSFEDKNQLTYLLWQRSWSKGRSFVHGESWENEKANIFKLFSIIFVSFCFFRNFFFLSKINFGKKQQNVVVDACMPKARTLSKPKHINLLTNSITWLELSCTSLIMQCEEGFFCRHMSLDSMQLPWFPYTMCLTLSPHTL